RAGQSRPPRHRCTRPLGPSPPDEVTVFLNLYDSLSRPTPQRGPCCLPPSICQHPPSVPRPILACSGGSHFHPDLGLAEAKPPKAACAAANVFKSLLNTVRDQSLWHRLPA